MRRPLKNKLKGIIVFLMLFLAMSLFFYFLLNGGAFWKEIRYWAFLNSPFVSYDLKSGDILKIASAANLPPGANYELFVPHIEVQTPIVSPRGSGTAEILVAMEDGVALYPGSLAPGNIGRAVMLGHSSRASWYRGGYATVFALLPVLKPGDTIYIAGQGKKYTYKVSQKSVMSPNDTNALLLSEPNDSEIALITCYPIGSASERIVVQAKLISTESI